MMYVKFKKNPEPCLQYRLIDSTPIVQYDELLKKYCECIAISVLGMVPAELLDEATHPENTDAIDIVVHLKK